MSIKEFLRHLRRGRAGTGAALDAMLLADAEAGFDASYYATSTKLQFRSPVRALQHYRAVGSRAGLRPRADFDPLYYRRSNPDVERAGYEPLAHFYRFGRYEGRAGTMEQDALDDEGLALPDLPKLVALGRPPAAVPLVDVVIPVYGSRRLTLRSLESVLKAAVSTPYEIFVIDDASPDRTLREELRALAAAGLLRLLENERNLGFVATANRGLALHQDRDVVLLNSDTRVFDGWLDRLLAALHRRPDIGTASPISNAATILSYPVFLRDNHRVPGVDFAQVDRLCAQFASPPVDLPTALGFCMAIKRSCLAAVGPFDRENFGRGYGEENDFSLRAIARGWRTVASPDVFVWHRGGASFGKERLAHSEAAQRTLERLHPGYGASVQKFIRLDPLAAVRQELDLARIRSDSRRKILWLGSRPSSFAEDSASVAVVPDLSPFLGAHRVRGGDMGPTPNIARLNASASVADWTRLLEDLKIQEICVEYQTLKADQRLRKLASAAKRLDLPLSSIRHQPVSLP